MIYTHYYGIVPSKTYKNSRNLRKNGQTTKVSGINGEFSSCFSHFWPPATSHSNVTTNPDTQCVLHVCDIGMGGRGDGKKILKPIELVSFLFMKFGVPLRRKNGQTTKVSVIFVHLSQKPSQFGHFYEGFWNFCTFYSGQSHHMIRTSDYLSNLGRD